VYLTLADAVARQQMQGENWERETVFRVGEASFADASKTPFTHRLKNVGNTTFHTINIEFCSSDSP
jgi:hypothetical protein